MYEPLSFQSHLLIIFIPKLFLISGFVPFPLLFLQKMQLQDSLQNPPYPWILSLFVITTQQFTWNPFCYQIHHSTFLKYKSVTFFFIVIRNSLTIKIDKATLLYESQTYVAYMITAN